MQFHHNGLDLEIAPLTLWTGPGHGTQRDAMQALKNVLAFCEWSAPLPAGKHTPDFKRLAEALQGGRRQTAKAPMTEEALQRLRRSTLRRLLQGKTRQASSLARNHPIAPDTRLTPGPHTGPGITMSCTAAHRKEQVEFRLDRPGARMPANELASALQRAFHRLLLAPLPIPLHVPERRGSFCSWLPTRREDTPVPPHRKEFEKALEAALQTFGRPGWNPLQALQDLRLRHPMERQILLIEKPELHLDPGEIRRCAGLLCKTAQAGITVVCTTHSPVLLSEINLRIQIYSTMEEQGRLPRDLKTPYTAESGMNPEKVRSFEFSSGQDYRAGPLGLPHPHLDGLLHAMQHDEERLTEWYHS